jgi:glycosyltransferase involved in cell wall biosynthesis
MKIESKLTVLISNYNHGKYIDNLIHSIISQTLKPEKIIIIDDGSNDNSHQILQKYKGNKLFQIILNNKNEGVIFRMNQGIKLINT